MTRLLVKIRSAPKLSVRELTLRLRLKKIASLGKKDLSSRNLEVDAYKTELEILWEFDNI